MSRPRDRRLKRHDPPSSPVNGGRFVDYPFKVTSLGVTGSALSANTFIFRNTIPTIRFSAEEGDVTVAGFDATFSSHQVYFISAEQGSVAVTGIEATFEVKVAEPANNWFNAEWWVSPFFGSQFWPTTLYHRNITADLGSVAITAADASLEHHHQFTAEIGSFLVTGTPAELTWETIIFAEVGSVTVAGLDATFSTNDTIVADTGSVLVSGIDATLTYYPTIDLTADAGSVLITGLDATFNEVYTIVADVGSLLVTGLDATFVETKAITGDVGSVNITGVDALLQYRRLSLAHLDFNVNIITDDKWQF